MIPIIFGGYLTADYTPLDVATVKTATAVAKKKKEGEEEEREKKKENDRFN